MLHPEMTAGKSLSHFPLHCTCAKWHKGAVIFAFLSNEHTTRPSICNVGSYIAGEMACSAGHPLHWIPGPWEFPQIAWFAEASVRQAKTRTRISFAKVCSLACGSFKVAHGLRCRADFPIVSKNLPNEVIHVRFGVAQQQRITLLM